MPDRVIPPRTKDPKELDRFYRTICQELNLKECTSQSDSTATTVSDLKDDFNALLAKMKTKHLMES